MDHQFASSGGGRLGITVEPLAPALAEQLGVGKGTQGVVVRASGPAAEAGVRSNRG